jgi:arsenate reductase (glutaredoxin)
MNKSVTIYGIKTCDTMKKARAWLDTHAVPYVFHDYKVRGIDHDMLESWARSVGWETLLNRAGTTYRKLPDASKADLDQSKAIALMLAQPSMIKRPVLEAGGRLIVGFTPETYSMRLQGRRAPKN